MVVCGRVVPQAVRDRRDLGAGSTVAERVGRCSPAAGRGGGARWRRRTWLGSKVGQGRGWW